MKEQKIEYKLNDLKFRTRLELIEYCQKNSNSEQEEKNIFDTAEFLFLNLPDKVSEKNYISPIEATKRWIIDLKNKEGNKPIVLLFSGGLDSIFALKCMIKSNCIPDYLLTYTYNPFDDDNFFCASNIEPLHALEYAKEIIHKTPALKNTKIWNIHLDKAFTENFYSDKNWLRLISNDHSVETPNQWSSLYKIDDLIAQNYTFIKGGNFPKVATISEKLYFYIVDLQLGQIVDNPENACYDFVLDNPLMFNSLCVKYKRQYDKDINDLTLSEHTPSYKTDFADKRLLQEFSESTYNLPPQFDKRFNTLLSPIEDAKLTSDYPLRTWLNRTPLKSWVFYLQAELFNPDWFVQYKKTISKYEEWIKKCHSYSGKITKLIPVE